MKNELYRSCSGIIFILQQRPLSDGKIHEGSSPNPNPVQPSNYPKSPSQKAQIQMHCFKNFQIKSKSAGFDETG